MPERAYYFRCGAQQHLPRPTSPRLRKIIHPFTDTPVPGKNKALFSVDPDEAALSPIRAAHTAEMPVRKKLPPVLKGAQVYPQNAAWLQPGGRKLMARQHPQVHRTANAIVPRQKSRSPFPAEVHEFRSGRSEAGTTHSPQLLRGHPVVPAEPLPQRCADNPACCPSSRSATP